MVEAILDHMGDALARGENVKISGFGTFLLRDKKQRIGRNPKTGVEVPITPRRVLTFRASQILKDRIAKANAWRMDHGDLTVRRRQGCRRAAHDRRSRAERWASSSTCCAIGNSSFPMLKPLKRSGGRRYYRPEDIRIVDTIDRLVNREGYTLQGRAQGAAKGGSPGWMSTQARQAGARAARTSPPQIACDPRHALPPRSTLTDRAASSTSPSVPGPSSGSRSRGRARCDQPSATGREFGPIVDLEFEHGKGRGRDISRPPHRTARSRFVRNEIEDQLLQARIVADQQHRWPVVPLRAADRSGWPNWRDRPGPASRPTSLRVDRARLLRASASTRSAGLAITCSHFDPMLADMLAHHAAPWRPRSFRPRSKSRRPISSQSDLAWRSRPSSFTSAYPSCGGSAIGRDRIAVPRNTAGEAL